MDLSVVVPTLNGRDRLARCLDSLAEYAPDAEVIVVNGPSADGTTGMVRERDDVDVLLEICERNINVARNAGVRAASGDAIALLDDDLCVDSGWYEAIEEATTRADVVTGPTDRGLDVRSSSSNGDASSSSNGDASSSPNGDVDRFVTRFDGGNVAFTRPAVESIDGFDEHLRIGGALDAAHRLTNRNAAVEWHPGMAVRGGVGTDGGTASPDGSPRLYVHTGEFDDGWTYRALTYRLVKNHGLRPAVVAAFVRELAGRTSIRDRTGERPPTHNSRNDERSPMRWLVSCWSILCNVLVGARSGLLARMQDRSDRRNPNGVTARADRAVERYDWR